MSKFKVGDKVEVVRLKNPENPFYGIGAKGKVVDDQWESPLVQFTKGPYQSTDDASWFVCAQDIELVKEGKMKKSEGYGNFVDGEGDGYVVTKGWAVEVDGELENGLVYFTRRNARGARKIFSASGSKATVRRVEIKVLKHKV